MRRTQVCIKSSRKESMNKTMSRYGILATTSWMARKPHRLTLKQSKQKTYRM